MVQIMAWRQASIWTDEGLSCWRIYASLGLSEFTIISGHGRTVIKKKHDTCRAFSHCWGPSSSAISQSATLPEVILCQVVPESDGGEQYVTCQCPETGGNGEQWTDSSGNKKKQWMYMYMAGKCIEMYIWIYTLVAYGSNYHTGARTSARSQIKQRKLNEDFYGTVSHCAFGVKAVIHVYHIYYYRVVLGRSLWFESGYGRSSSDCVAVVSFGCDVPQFF